jgi:hypothetical protein
MGKINVGKVIVGGLVAGLVYNVLDFAMQMLMAAEFEANTTRLGLDPAAAQAPAAIATWVAIDFLVGILVVFIYAAIRPRFGPGPKTAVIAGLIPFIWVSLVMYGFTTMGMFATAIYFKATALQLVNVLAGAVAGAAVYKET